MRRLRRFLGGDAIGEIVGIYCDFFKAPHFGGFREEMRHVLLLDMAIHTFDAARLLAGAKRPRRCIAGKAIRPGPGMRMGRVRTRSSNCLSGAADRLSRIVVRGGAADELGSRLGGSWVRAGRSPGMAKS